MSAQGVNQKDYLKKYLSSDDKKKKKKKKTTKAVGDRFRIVDDDIDLKNMRPLDDDEVDLYNLNEDAPQIAGIIDERPDEVRVREQFGTKRWKIVADENGFDDVKYSVVENKSLSNKDKSEKNEHNGTVGESSERSSRSDNVHRKSSDLNSEQITSRKYKGDSDSDISPPRARQPSRGKSSNKPTSVNSDSDVSPPRKSKAGSEVAESPEARVSSKVRSMNKSKTSTQDSPQRRKRAQDDSDESPPRKTTKNQHYSESSNKKLRRQDDADTSTNKLRRHPESHEMSPRRHKRQDSDESPPRRLGKNSSKFHQDDSDESPPRRARKQSSDESTPRKGSRDSSESPHQKSKFQTASSRQGTKTRKQYQENFKTSYYANERYSAQHKRPYDSDRQKQFRNKREFDEYHQKKWRKQDGNNSPPRKRDNRRDYDVSPRRHSDKHYLGENLIKSKNNFSDGRYKNKSYETNKRENHNSESPPRRKGHDSQPAKRSQQHYSDKQDNSDSDQSPPRYSRADKSPNRTSSHSEAHDSSQNIKKKSNTASKKSKADDVPQREDPQARKTDNNGPRKKDDRMLDGMRAGLQSKEQLRQEIQEYQQREMESFAKLDPSVSGEGVAAVLRDRKTGKRRNLEQEARDRQEEQKAEAEHKSKYSRWGKGLKQVEDQTEKLHQDLYEMSKPLARYADDKDLERHLRDQEREGDPMLQYIRSKKKESGVKGKPKYEGSYMPNRYYIPPGYRWDGVDRSNGYEKKWFEEKNARRAREEEAYKWSSADM